MIKQCVFAVCEKLLLESFYLQLFQLWYNFDSLVRKKYIFPDKTIILLYADKKFLADVSFHRRDTVPEDAPRHQKDVKRSKQQLIRRGSQLSINPAASKRAKVEDKEEKANK